MSRAPGEGAINQPPSPEIVPNRAAQEKGPSTGGDRALGQEGIVAFKPDRGSWMPGRIGALLFRKWQRHNKPKRMSL
jgi:hypothetical protein